MKKVLSVLTALVLVIALAVPAMAAQITIKPNSKVSLDGRTFTAYRILDAKRSAADNSKIVYSVPDGAKAFVAGYLKLDANAANFNYKATEAIRAMNDDARMAFADAALKAIAGGTVTGIDGVAGTNSGENYVFDGLEEGYYIIKDDATQKPVSALMLASAGATIEIKADKPSVDKKIDGDNDADESTTGLVDSNNSAVGDVVPYIVTSVVPSTKGYAKYKMVFTDTLSDGLTYNNDLEVYVDGEKVTTGYTASAVGQEIKVTFDNVKGMDTKKIELKYSATVNENAVIGVKGNPNKVNLEYSNNPNNENETEKTPDKVTRTFVTEFALIKVDRDDHSKLLPGAEFELTGTKLNTVIVTNADGKQTFKVKEEAVTVKATTDANGKILFTGLAAGTYVIKEIKAPDGYNILDDAITVTIGFTAPANDTDDCTWTYSDNLTVVDGVATITVENGSGTELPSTGGIGTTIFYVVGGLLVVGAAIVLITRRRLAVEK